jgi:hypothetical protein
MKNPRKKAQRKSVSRTEKTGHAHAHEGHSTVYRILADGSVKKEHAEHPDNS